jgi:hypothetical protein
MTTPAWFAGLWLVAVAASAAANSTNQPTTNPTTTLTTTCPLAPPALQQGLVQLAWQLEGPAVTVGRHFVIEIQLCPVGATLQRVDAHMPEHRHGMNYRPSLKQLAPGRWRAEGLLFHMPGRWELVFDVQEPAPAAGPTVRRVTLRESLTLP